MQEEGCLGKNFTGGIVSNRKLKEICTRQV